MAPGPWRGHLVKASDGLTLCLGPRRTQNADASAVVVVGHGGHETRVSPEQFLTIL